jgi:hypothetical protein
MKGEKILFEELKKYEINNHFFFKSIDNLKDVCNAPSDKSGVYLVYAIENNIIELIYIGRSGKIKSDGKIFIRKAGLGGIKDRIVNGHQFGKVPRKISWPSQMQKEKIDLLRVHWYVTHNLNYKDCPRKLENELLRQYLKDYGSLPRWNTEL